MIHKANECATSFIVCSSSLKSVLFIQLHEMLLYLNRFKLSIATCFKCDSNIIPKCYLRSGEKLNYLDDALHTGCA
jgi:hypothetical protein